MGEPIFGGWSRGLNQWGDDTRIWHARVLEPAATLPGVTVSRAACERRQRLSGQTEPLPPDARVCQRLGCAAMWRRHGRRP